MKLTILLLACGSILLGCTNKTISPDALTSISVVRETEKMLPQHQQPISPVASTPVTTPTGSHVKYHIIVASFSPSEKVRAEKLVSQLKAKNYPATLLYSSKRYRVSIESFTNEKDANAARDEYRAITDRNDIWVHKTE